MNHEPTDPLNDPALEREIESLLAVDPSPEFVARVRTRIAQEPAPTAWRWSWSFVLAGAAAAVVLAVLVTSWMARVTPTGVPQQAAAREDVGLEAEPSLVRSQPATTREIGNGGVRSVRLQSDARGGRLPAAREDAPPFTGVIFSEAERRALLTLVAAVEEGRVPPFPVAPAVDADVLPEGTALMIEPLVIDPLPQIARLEE